MDYDNNAAQAFLWAQGLPPYSMYSFTPYPRYVGYLGSPYCGDDINEPPCRKLADLSDDEQRALAVEFIASHRDLFPTDPQPPTVAFGYADPYTQHHVQGHDPHEPLPQHISQVLTTARKLACLYPLFDCFVTDCDRLKFYLLLAHDLTLQQDDYKQSAITSASVGDSSVSYDSTLSSKLASNPFYLYLSKTRPGSELLNLLRQSAVIVV